MGFEANDFQLYFFSLFSSYLISYFAKFGHVLCNTLISFFWFWLLAIKRIIMAIFICLSKNKQLQP